MTAAAGLTRVHLRGLPVGRAAQAREHFEGLTREFMLISEGGADDQVPARLMQLVHVLTQQFGGINSEADQRLEDAIEAGTAVLDDHVLVLPPEAGPAAEALGRLIDEADEYCRQGEHLLTLATPPELVAYRHWYLGEVLAQLSGRRPTAWPDSVYASAHEPSVP